jgi:uncharacterized membrane protein YedE/YeeE
MNLSIQNALIGGLFIGLSASLLMLTIGKISGLSGIFSGLMTSFKEQWRWYFLVGFLLGAWLIRFLFPEFVNVSRLTISLPWMMLAGILVGFGTRIGGGCTSGHGVCGISRLSKRSIIATVIFIGSAMAVVWIRSH